jgi:hypothetical protein
MARYLMNGLVVESNLPFSSYRLYNAPSDVSIDLLGTRVVPAGFPAGQLLQSLALPGRGVLCSTVQTPLGGYCVRAHNHVDFEVSSDLHNVSAWSDERCPPEMVAILASGLLLSVLLTLMGELVLHASAVEDNGAAVAFAAESGMGKSTLAAIACSLGASLVTDDLLRVDLAEGQSRCYLGSGENRLRREAVELGAFYAEARTSTSVDGRTLLRPPMSEVELCPLSAVVLPRPDRRATHLELTRLDSGAAVMEVSDCLRARGWHTIEMRRALFVRTSRFVAMTPIYLARLPWGPPFNTDDVTALLQKVRLSV